MEREIGETGLLQDLATCRLRGRFAFTDVSLGESPVAIGIEDDENARPRPRAAKHYATGAHLEPGRRTPLHLEDGELEVFAGVGLDVRQECAELDDGQSGLAIER